MELVQAAKALINEITTEQASSLLNSGAQALDVREPAEFEAGHIANAHHIPRGMLEFMIANNSSLKNKDTEIVVYCKTGGRSALAAATLLQLGYTNVSSMMGGFDLWEQNK